MPSKDPLPPKESALFRKILVNWCIALLFYYFLDSMSVFVQGEICAALCVSIGIAHKFSDTLCSSNDTELEDCMIQVQEKRVLRFFVV